MFGYVRCANDELKVKDIKRYQAYYCGVCKAMGKFTVLGRCVLSYDLAFYSLLMDCKANCEIKLKRCAANGKRKPYAVGEPIDYAGYINILLAVGKLKDDIKDKERYKKILLFLMKKANNKAEKSASHAVEICNEYLQKLERLQEQCCECVDECASVFAQMCAELCSSAPFITDVKIKRILFSIGYSVARWVYIVDALDDYDKDVKKEVYNPIIAEVKAGKLKKSDIFSVFSSSLYNTLYDALQATQLLPDSSNKPIIMNIVQYGLRDVTDRVLNNFKKCQIESEELNERSL